MRLPLITILVFFVLNAATDWYILRTILACRYREVIRQLFKNKTRCSIRSRQFWGNVQFWSAAIFALGLLVLMFFPIRSISDAGIRTLMWVLYVYISIYAAKIIFVVCSLIGRLPILWHKKTWRPMNTVGCVLAAIVFLSMWWGTVNRYNIEVKEVSVYIKNLPRAFDGFRIVQISDFHVGSYGSTDFAEKVVKQINELHPDLIVFTGDIVNRRTAELEPFTDVLSELKAPYGVYSILGNHDYGDYYEWPDSAAQKQNIAQMKELQRRMGWKLLDNKYDNIVIGNDTLVLIGVENIGDPPFKRYGDLKTAYPTPGDSKIKILLSHNPAHWVEDIANSDNNIALTLSGHTHAMQATFFGFSPARLRYRTWGGLFEDNNQKHQLYVNIGLGTVAMPARIGATPEITVLTLRNS